MKLTNQVLRSRSVGPLHSTKYLDLSNLELVSLGRLTSCPKVETIILHGNGLQDASGLDVCQQLWHLDLSNNQLQSVDGLSRFLGLGTLVLSNNHLTWPDLAHLRHMHILSLSLHGNEQLEKDPYYRLHVIDCLPNVWMLDGRLVTSAERIQVRQFFQDSALTDRPVRRKLRKDGFIPSTLKKIEIDGIFGDKAVQMMTTFPKNAVLNIETDWKRLHYLAQTCQDDINLKWEYTARKPGQTPQKRSLLRDLFEARESDRERCNMVLLILVASLDFLLPTHLVKDTLETGKLLTLGNIQTMDLFLMPRSLRCKVVSLLLSAVKVDREQNEDGGLYSKLYLCLYHMVSELTKLSETASASQSAHDSKLASQLRDYKCLLATEVVQLMCIVPSFFDYLDRDIGVMNLVRIATADPDINEKLVQISKTAMEDGGDKEQNAMFKEMADFLLVKVQEQLQNLTNKSAIMSACDHILSKSGALPMKGEKSPVCKADYLVKGVNSPDDDPPAVNPRKMSAKARTKFPHLGDRMLLGPQTVGKIISLPQPTMALVIIDAVPVATGAVEHKLKESEHHYTYVNVDQLEWDTRTKMWKPKGTVGDKFTLQAAEDFSREAGNRPGDESYRPGTPELVALPTDLQAIRASTPLIYTHSTPRQRVRAATEFTAHKPPRARRPQRPLSSVYKERLKLSLDLSRRAHSAGSRQPFNVTFGPTSSTPKTQKTPMLRLDHVSGMKVDPKEGEAWSSRPVSSARAAQETFIHEQSCLRTAQVSARDSQPAAKSTPKEDTTQPSEKENKPPAGEINAEKQTEPEPEVTNEGKGQIAAESQATPPVETTRSESGLRVRDKVVVDSTQKEKWAEPQQDGSETRKEFFMTAVNESSHTVVKSYTGHQLAGRSRPVSAIERQQVMAVSGRMMVDGVYHTEFQQQRINAWKQTTRPASQPKATQPTNPPPPQRPSSPIPNEEPPQDNLSQATSLETISILSVQRPHTDHAILKRRIPQANLWLAGGRDLFWEGMKSQPRSGHTPGWKEDLPDSMKARPKSAAARLHKRSKTPVGHPSSSVKSECIKHGHNLSDLADFPDERPAPVVLSMSRRYNSQRSLYEEDPLPGPVAESVYSPMTVWSYQREYGFNHSCLPCLYESYLDELQDNESFYTPTCNTPTKD